MTRVLSFIAALLLLGTVAGYRVTSGDALLADQPQPPPQIPPELLAQLRGMVVGENLPELLARLPESQRAAAETMLPLINDDAVFETVVGAVVGQMDQDQQQGLAGTLSELDSAGVGPNSFPGGDEAGVLPPGFADNPALQDLVGSLADSLTNGIAGAMTEPGFIGAVLGSMAASGGNAAIHLALQALLPGAGNLTDHLVEFMDLDGDAVFENADRLLRPRNASDQRYPMDGPLRTVFLVANLLSHSAAMEQSEVSEEPSADFAAGHDAYDVHSPSGELLPEKWWLPDEFVQAARLLFTAVHLEILDMSLTKTQFLHGDLLTASLSLGEVGGDRILAVESVPVAAGRNATSDFGDTAAELYLILSLYEEQIRGSIGFGRFGSLLDVFYLAAQSAGSMGWLGSWSDALGNAGDVREHIQADLRDGMRNNTALLLRGTLATDELRARTTMLFTGVSFGGSVARMMAAHLRLSCEACRVVALTTNAPNVRHVARTLEIVSHDIDPTTGESLRAAWARGTWGYSAEDEAERLERHDALFGSFYNFVSQHDLVWKLDRELPAARTCMYMHPAESTGCQGLSTIDSIYSNVLRSTLRCRGAHDGYAHCLMRHAAPAIGCMFREHAFVVEGELNMSSLIQGDSVNVSHLTGDSSIVAGLLTVFSHSRTSRAPEDSVEANIRWMKERTGETLVTGLTAEEAEVNAAEEAAFTEELAAWVQASKEDVLANWTAQDESINEETAALPSCTGCQEEWCEDNDISAHRCCTASDNQHCTNPPFSRTMCRNTYHGEQCMNHLQRVLALGHTQASERRGTRCSCVRGFCYNAGDNECQLDPHVDTRAELMDHRHAILAWRNSADRHVDHLAEGRREAWDASRLTMFGPTEAPTSWLGRTFSRAPERVPAKPDPSMQGTWICS